MKPIKLYSHTRGANPWKVVIILNELGLAYDSEFPKPQEEPYLSVNPNGRFPAIKDPNTGITLWESGSIIEYLLDVYDPGHNLSYTSSPEKYEQNNWKYFQASGQGPNFGQYFWFAFFHEEKIASAQDRYLKEIKRVWSVFDRQLSKTGRSYLVGDRVCFADIMFVTWNQGAVQLLGEEFSQEMQEKCPRAWDWHQKLMARDSVKATYEAQAKVLAAQGG